MSSDPSGPTRMDRPQREAADPSEDRPIALVYLLESDIRRRVLNWVCATDPDSETYGNDLCAELDTKSYTLKQHREVIEKFGLWEVTRQAAYLYSPIDSERRDTLCSVDALIRETCQYSLTELCATPAQRSLLDFFLSRADVHEHLTKSAIGDKIGRTRQAVYDHLQPLVDAGIVGVDEGSGYTTYYPNVQSDTYRGLIEANVLLTEYYLETSGDLTVE